MSPAPTSQIAVNVTIDAAQVNELLGVVYESISGPSLERFLVEVAGPWFERDIEERFNEEGDVKTGFWPPLSQTTQRIRRSLGYGDTEPINVRTEDLFDFVVQHRTFEMGPDFAAMQVPGNPPDPITARKLTVAQQGTTDNPMFPGAYTPPRPVLAADEGTLEVMLNLLNQWVAVHVAEGLVASGGSYV